MIKIRTMLKGLTRRSLILIAAGCLAALFIVGAWLLAVQPWNQTAERIQPPAPVSETAKAETSPPKVADQNTTTEGQPAAQPTPTNSTPRQAVTKTTNPVSAPPAPVIPSVTATPLTYKDESDVLCALTTETTLTSSTHASLQVVFHYKKGYSGNTDIMSQHVYLPANTPTKVVQFANFIEPTIPILEISVSIADTSVMFTAPAPLIVACS